MPGLQSQVERHLEEAGGQAESNSHCQAGQYELSDAGKVDGILACDGILGGDGTMALAEDGPLPAHRRPTIGKLGLTRARDCITQGQ